MIDESELVERPPRADHIWSGIARRDQRAALLNRWRRIAPLAGQRADCFLACNDLVAHVCGSGMLRLEIVAPAAARRERRAEGTRCGPDPVSLRFAKQWEHRRLYAAAALFLAALLGPDFLPPAPTVLFTQVDAAGRELGDSFRAQCAGDVCRTSFVVEFASVTCLVNALVKLPLLSRQGSIMISVSPCAPDSLPLHRRNLGQLADFTLDAHGATNQVVNVASTGACGSPRNDLVVRYCDNALVRVDIVLWTTARP